MKKALVTGAGGQDGSYLVELLLKKDYEVFALIRRKETSYRNLNSIWNHPNLRFLYGDVQNISSLICAFHKAWPDEVYNLAAQSFVPSSWMDAAFTFDVNAGGLARLLEAAERIKPDARIYQAGTSEMFGYQEGHLNARSRMNPTSPYGVSKLAAHHLCQVYRKKGMFVVSGICFNHESPRRNREMVTMKIASHVARFSRGVKEPLSLGSLDGQRDWGYAPDYVLGMWQMLQQKKPVDYVLGTGETHSVDEFLSLALQSAKIDEQEFREKYLQQNSQFLRVGDVKIFKADIRTTKKELNWEPKLPFPELVRCMVSSEIESLRG
ncbi:MAG: GDP-mannose 4,6-dehydratase [Patescibacteria group bacterium]|nr:GDP-mannose 4,6-dehydratase [Patescibacteria group bacterium]